ncbi:LANO_0H15522g1_1 [Lachancea nothofagi CBS 11611]|uniref:LANO_0H15522g1_1 n=1 Tax=Lachancea nothofagi CBS 11611 TaxID=1266666 RepID=A0A1G4KMR7_9SACH|nr:LANO_0H15522g1_1 [Lachancea nothofagi CBS 11611]
MFRVTLRSIASLDSSALLHRTVLGIGTDLVHLPRFTKIVGKCTPILENKRMDRLLGKFMHTVELCRLKEMLKDGDGVQNMTRYIAGVWATKEAVYKSLASQNLASTMPPARIIYTKLCYKINDTDGSPKVMIDKNFATAYPEFMRCLIADTEFLISLSHDQDYLVSYVCHVRV